jgi:hypothetical protein
MAAACGSITTSIAPSTPISIRGDATAITGFGFGLVMSILHIWNWLFHFDGPERRHWRAMGLEKQEQENDHRTVRQA